MSLKIKTGNLYRTKSGFPVKIFKAFIEWKWPLPEKRFGAFLGLDPGVLLACVYKKDGTPVNVSGFKGVDGFELVSEIPSTKGLHVISGGKAGEASERSEGSQPNDRHKPKG